MIKVKSPQFDKTFQYAIQRIRQSCAVSTNSVQLIRYYDDNKEQDRSNNDYVERTMECCLLAFCNDLGLCTQFEQAKANQCILQVVLQADNDFYSQRLQVSHDAMI